MEQSAVVQQQPDFGAMATKMHELGDQVGLFRNLPSVAQGQLQQRLLEEMAALRRVVNDGFQVIVTRLDRTDRVNAAERENHEARRMNAHVMHDNVALKPLYNTSTGEVVRQCPTTLRQLDGYNSRQVDGLLAALGQTVPDGLDLRSRKAYVELAMGVAARAVGVPR